MKEKTQKALRSMGAANEKKSIAVTHFQRPCCIECDMCSSSEAVTQSSNIWTESDMVENLKIGAIRPRWEVLLCENEYIAKHCIIRTHVFRQT
jgi:hypothetical protein